MKLFNFPTTRLQDLKCSPTIFSARGCHTSGLVLRLEEVSLFVKDPDNMEMNPKFTLSSDLYIVCHQILLITLVTLHRTAKLCRLPLLRATNSHHKSRPSTRNVIHVPSKPDALSCLFLLLVLLSREYESMHWKGKTRKNNINGWVAAMYPMIISPHLC